MHLIVRDVADLPKVDRVDHLIVSVLLVAIEILGLATVTGIVEEEGIVWTGILNKPMHSPENVLLSRLAHGVLLVVCEDNHVLALIAKVFDEVCRHVPDIIDATPKLTALAKVVYSNQQRFPPPSALRVLESISLRRTISEMLGSLGWWRGCIVIPVYVGVRVYRRHIGSSVVLLWRMLSRLLELLGRRLLIAIALGRLRLVAILRGLAWGGALLIGIVLRRVVAAIWLLLRRRGSISSIISSTRIPRHDDA